MEGYSYPLTVEGHWPLTQTRTITTKLQVYFQSKKKSQGGDCVVNFSEQTSAATVHFKTAESRNQVLAYGDHSVTIDNQVVKLKVFKPSDGKSQTEEPSGAATTGSDTAAKILQTTSLDESLTNSATEPSLTDRSGDSSWSGAVVLEELPDNFSKDVLVLLVENISGVSEEEYFLEMISELNVAVVTFNDPDVAEKFLTESRTNKKFQQYGITSRPLENTRSIKVESLPAQVSTELLELYFEKWGGAVEKITMIPEEQAAIITLQQQQDVDRILGKDHHIGRTPVTIYPYVMSLGTALYGKDTPEWNLPKPFTEKIHPAIREFLHKKDLISSILKQMESVFCQVNMDKAEVQLSPLPTLLKQKKITKKDIDSWRQNSTDEFRDILSSYDVFEHAIIPSIWSTVEKDIRSLVKDKAFMSMDNAVLTLAGMAQDIKLLKPILENVLKKASDQMNRDKNSVSENIEMPPSMYSLFLQEGLQSTATGKYPELKLTYSNDTNQLMLRGLSLEIIDIKNWILERKLSMKQTPFGMDLSERQHQKAASWKAGLDKSHSNPATEPSLTDRSRDSSRSGAVVLEELPDNFSKDVLVLLVEVISSVSEEEYFLEMISELNVAVVTFNDPDVAEKFLTESTTNKKCQQYGITSRPLENTRSIKVESLPAQGSTELLELYFEKWGGAVEKITMIPEEQAAIITLQQQQDVDRILGKDHHICRTPVTIYPYVMSLGTALYGKDRPEWKLPKPFTEKIHPAIREFLHKKDLISSILKQMESVFCQVNMDKAEVQLSPLPTLLKQQNITKKDIDSWRQNSTDEFRDILSSYDVFEHAVIPSIWSTVEMDIWSLVKDKAFMSMDNGVLSLAGMAQDIKLLKPILENVLKKASDHMKRDNSVSVSIKMSPAMFTLFLQEGLQSTATGKYPELKLTYRNDTNHLTLRGLILEIIDIKNWILERKLSMKQKPLKMDPSLLDFLKSVNCEEMSECLFTSKGICAVCRVENGDVVLTGSTDKALTEAEKKLQMTLASSTLSLEDLGVLEKPEWRSLCDELCDTYNSAKKKTVVIHHPKHGDGLIISGFRDPVSEVSRSLEKFINAHSNIKEVVRASSYAMVKFILEKKSEVWQSLVKNNEVTVDFDPIRPLIRLSGERMHVQPAMETLQKISDALLTDKLPIKKAGAKKYFQEQGSMFFVMMRDRRFVVVLEESHVLDEDEDNFEEDRVEGFGQSSCEVQVPGGIVITVRKADICQFKVDAVVNAANEDLKHIGGVAMALLKAAGPSLQEWSDQYVSVNGRVRPGQAVTTQAGRLPCKIVVHAVGPRFSDTDKSTAVKRLRQVVRESLNQAERNNCSSIAVPAISSGIFGFPLELCTETIAKELHAYVEDQKFQSGMNMLKQIHLVDNNGNTVNAMAQAVRKEFAAYNPRMTFPQHGSGRHGREDQGQEYDGQGKHGNGHRNVEKEFETRGATWEINPSQRPRTQGGDTGSSVSLETQSTPEGLRISLKKGNIQDARSDVIVNNISQSMDLSQGAVSKALLQAAGPQLQSEARSRSSNLSYGDLVVTDGYNLNCKKVFHTVCPFWNSGANSEDKALKKIIRDCLIEAEQQNMFSISFPAIGTSNLGFPKDVVSSTLLREIHDFSSRDRPRCLKEVTVIVHPSDQETVKSFINSFRGGRPGFNTKGEHAIHQVSPKKAPPSRPSQSSGLLGGVSTPTLGVHRVQVGHVTLEVSSGDITRERCDAIVNSSNQSFSLRSGVSKAILDAAGRAVEEECAQMVSSQSLQQKEMIVTSGGQLPSRYIIHIIGRNNPADIKDAVYSVLKLCEELKFSSVAFPALGTGQGGASPSAVADAMIDAVIDFVGKKKGPLLQSVKFLIFQTSMVSDFHQSMLRKQQEGVEDTSMLGRIKDLFNIFRGSGPEPGQTSQSETEDFEMVGEEFEPAVFQLCAETRQDLNEARELISSFIVREQTCSSIRDSAINRFTKEDAETLTNLQRELTVSIQLNKTGPEPVITVEGLTRDVVKAESTIRDMIRQVEKNETRKQEAFMLSSMVEWQYLDSRNQMVPFDIYINFDLEEAFAKKQPRIKIKIDNEQYEVDLIRRMATGRNRMIELKRVDQKDVQSEPLPSHWEDMKGSFVKRVPVNLGSQEYTDVEKEFRRTGLNNQILNIERVQSETLWRSYVIQKKHLEEKNKHKNNERKLFHGTVSENIDKIDDRGFNRSYAGMHGAVYGNGVYFAVDPSYSARGYAKADRLGHKRMYLARVLVGDYTTGRAGLLSPPAKSSTATDLYDSVTDNQHNPTMFVIFHDVQAYPEYLITFQ